MKWMNIASEFAAAGKQPQAEVQAVFASLGHEELIDDALAWRVAVVAMCLHKSGVRPPPTLTGRAYLGFGTPIERARSGAICITKKGDDFAVSFVHSLKGDALVIIGGTEAGSVGLEMVQRSAVLALRWPVGFAGKSWLGSGGRSPSAPAPTAAPVDEQPARKQETISAITPDQPSVPHPTMPVVQPSMLSFRDILDRADDELSADPREQAMMKLRDIANRTAGGTNADQIRYELAMQAANGSDAALAMLSDEAHARGVRTADLANQIISDRRRQEGTVAAIGSILAHAEAVVGSIGDDEIDEFLRSYEDEIRNAEK